MRFHFDISDGVFRLKNPDWFRISGAKAHELFLSGGLTEEAVQNRRLVWGPNCLQVDYLFSIGCANAFDIRVVFVFAVA